MNERTVTHTAEQRLTPTLAPGAPELAAATDGPSSCALSAQDSYTLVRGEAETLNTTRALFELESAAYVAAALDSLTGVQFGGAGLEPEAFYTIASEIALRITHRLDAANRAISGTGISATCAEAV